MATSGSHTPISRVPADLEPLIQEERTRCTSLGVQLKIPLSVLQDLEKKSKGKKPISQCFQEMWQQWFYDKGDRKWIEIFLALKQQGHGRLRNILDSKYKPDTIVSPGFNFEGELKEMIPKWYQFGCALGVSKTDMDIIKKGTDSSEDYMISMLEEWKNTHEDNYTWEALQEALRVIGNNRLAKELEKHRRKDKQDAKMKVFSNPKAQVDGDGSSSEKYGCKVFYQRRGVNTWKITFAVFPCDKSDEVKCNEDEQEGLSCHFDLETDKLKIAPKQQAGWSSKVTRKEVTKASVGAYTGTGKAPFCEMTVEAASSQSTPPPLAMSVELEGPKPPIIMQLAENVPIQTLEVHKLKYKQEWSGSSASSKTLTKPKEESTAAYDQSGPTSYVGPVMVIEKPTMKEVTEKTVYVKKPLSTGNPIYATEFKEKRKTDGQEYKCQVFSKAYNKGDKYKVKLIFAFSRKHLGREVTSYFSERKLKLKDDTCFDKFVSEHVMTSVAAPKSGKWSMIPGKQKVNVSRESVDEYTGEDKHPHCVMVLEVLVIERRLRIDVTLKGITPFVTIKIDINLTDDTIYEIDTDSDTDSD